MRLKGEEPKTQEIRKIALDIITEVAVQYAVKKAVTREDINRLRNAKIKERGLRFTRKKRGSGDKEERVKDERATKRTSKMKLEGPKRLHDPQVEVAYNIEGVDFAESVRAFLDVPQDPFDC